MFVRAHCRKKRQSKRQVDGDADRDGVESFRGHVTSSIYDHYICLFSCCLLVEWHAIFDVKEEKT